MASADSQKAEAFVGVTGASDSVARRFLDMADGDVDRAVVMFFESPQDFAESTENVTTTEPNSAAPSEPTSINDILGLANKGEAEPTPSAGKGVGKKGSAGDGPVRKIGIVFFADGFMVDPEMEDDEEEEEESQDVAAKPPTRRMKMMSLDDLARENQGDMPPLPKKVPKLFPLRSYDTPENKRFLDDVKASRVPQGLQTTDEKGRPVPMSFLVSDERPATYQQLSKAIEEIKKLKEEQAAKERQKAPTGPALFTGAGHSLSSNAAPAASTAGAHGGSAQSCDPTLLALVKSGPPVLDESKAATTLQLKLSTGSRAKARLNLDHTVADVWRVVAKEMGVSTFAAASGHTLSAGFPPKPLTNNSLTLAEADLANASVTHRCS